MSTPTHHAGLLVVGGGPAAHHAASAYLEHGGTGPVLLVSDDDTPPYFRPPLSKDLLRGVTGENEIGLGDIDGAGIRTGTSVTGLSAPEHRAQLSDGSVVEWQQCVLATGAAPVQPPIPGAENALRLRYLSDARTLREQVRHAHSVVVVGSGFIGCEAAASLARRGLDVTVCTDERVPQAARLGDTVGGLLAGWLAADGIRFRGGSAVTGIEPTGHGQLVHLGDGDPVAGDLVLVVVGAVPRTELLDGLGVTVEHDRVVVDERMRSSVPDLLAAGDGAFARNASAGRHLTVEHWGDAETMGGVAGATAAGADAVWDSPPGFWTEIGSRTLKYSAWGDGHDDIIVSTHDADGFTAWYLREGVVVGVATHLADDDYERGAELVRTGAPASAAFGNRDPVAPQRATATVPRPGSCASNER